MTTTYALMTNQTLPSNAQGDAPAPNPVVIAGTPTRCQVTFSVSRASRRFDAQATVWGQTGAASVPYSTQIVPLLTVRLEPGGLGITQPLALSFAYQNVFARLDAIDPSQAVGASMSLVV
jgi:hypothetical protein